MQKRNHIPTLFMLTLLAGLIILLLTSAYSNTGTCQPESLDACCRNDTKSGKMIWEKLPHQFFSSYY